MSKKFFKNEPQWYVDLPEDAIAVFCDDNIIIYYQEATRGIYVDDAPSDWEPSNSEPPYGFCQAPVEPPEDPYRARPPSPEDLRQLYREGEDLTSEELALAYPDDYRKMMSGQLIEDYARSKKMETCPDKPEEPVDITDAIKALNTLQRYLGVS
jgi:hypothetical protein